jgi:hypothetical protein
MSCFKPISGYMSTLVRGGKIIGKNFTTHKPSNGYPFHAAQVPCGYCIGCRLEKSRQWALRCTHEAKMHKQNCFITLTFNPESLAKRARKSLDVREFQLFMKKLRQHIYRSSLRAFKARHSTSLRRGPRRLSVGPIVRKALRKKASVRFYHCGEYGAKYGRPHYHACLFGYNFPDKKLFKTTPNGSKLYTSKTLEKLWPYGYHSIARFDFNTAAYVARYTLKKIYGAAAIHHYPEDVNSTTGEVTSLQPEYSTMSRRPGIGKPWLDRYQSDIYPKDFVSHQGREMRPPRFYDKHFEAQFPQDFENLKRLRRQKQRKNQLDNTPERLDAKLRCAQASLKNLKRTYEGDPHAN